MKKADEKAFAKWEANKRIKMGDKAFLEKYIKSLPKTDIQLNILLPIALILSLVNAVMGIIYEDYFNIVFFFGVTPFWIYALCCHYFYRLDLHKRKVEEWKKELEELHNEIFGNT